MKNLLFFSLALVILSGCYYDNEEDLYPNETPCDTTNVTFSGTVLPILNDYCNACHGSGSQSGGIVLDNYESVSKQAKIPAGQPGSLYGAITHDPGNSPMPKSGGQLSDCNIKKIEIWIADGTPDN